MGDDFPPAFVLATIRPLATMASGFSAWTPAANIEAGSSDYMTKRL